MTDQQYGVTAQGYSRKSLALHLDDLERAMIAFFGTGIIQTPQSPLGQLNGMQADLLAEVDERNLDLYQSYDPDQSEGTRLDILAKLRLLNRGDLDDIAFRQAITNKDESNFGQADFETALKTIPDVTYAKVWINDKNNVFYPNAEPGSLSAAVLGGTDAAVAEVVQRFAPPGVMTAGNTYVEHIDDGFCREYAIVRPTDVPLNITVNVRRFDTSDGCPAPNPSAVGLSVVNGWNRIRRNGLTPTFFNIRQQVESTTPGVEIQSVTWSTVADPGTPDPTIAFVEIASITADNVTVVDVA